MYNRYINGPGFSAPTEPSPAPESAAPDPTTPDRPAPASAPQEPLDPAAAQPIDFSDVAGETQEAPPPPDSEEKPTDKGLGALKNLLGNRFKLPDFDSDTLLLLVLVYFLVADDRENISDTLLIIGALLLLGF